MFLRRAALALGSLALLTGLAACDLPGRAPAVVFDDRAPNDTIDEAQPILPTHTIRGTLDTQDQDDWYRIQAPRKYQSLVVTCESGDSFREVRINGTSSVNVCEPGQTDVYDTYPGDEIYVHLHLDEAQQQPAYAVKVSYETPSGGG